MHYMIVNLEPVGYSQKARERLLGVAAVEDILDPRSEANALREADIIITRLGRYIDEAFLSRCPRLKAIATATTGLNHVDLEAAARRKIDILSLRGESDFLATISATAELHWGLLLSIARHILPAHNSVLNAEWDRDKFQGMQLAGRTIGIIGYGRLGKLVAQYARAFRMRILAFDREPRAAEGIEFCEFDDLLRQSDILSVHLSLDAGSRGLISRQKLQLVKPGALFVNTARGEVVDEYALADAVASGRIAAAAVDVLANEAEHRGDFLHQSPLWNLAQTDPRVVLTPHIGGASPDAMRATEEFIAEKIVAYLQRRQTPLGDPQ